MKIEPRIIKHSSGKASIVISFEEDGGAPERRSGTIEVANEYHTGRPMVFWYSNRIIKFTPREFERLSARINQAVDDLVILNG